MPEQRVIVNGAIPAIDGDLEIRINHGDRTFRIRALGVPNHVVLQLAPRTLDLLLIASAVFAADSLVRRGGPTRPEFGADWCRQFHFVVPVRDLTFWPSAREGLVETLTFLTGDYFSFDFVPMPAPLRRQESLNLGPVQQVRADEVILFSGGLDSLTGVLETLSSGDAKVLLVTHRSATKVATIQTALWRELHSRFRDRIHWVPVRGTLVQRDPAETTQRSRSFFYAALGYAAASLVDAKRVRFFENGIVSVNLSISRQVVTTMATRTTHPLFLRLVGQLLSGLAGSPVEVDNPYAWMTKTEVVKRLADLGGAGLIGTTTSCSGVRKRTKKHPLCGCCSQCLDRRFATLAAGVAEHDTVDRYEVELLRGRRDDPDDRTMAWDWTRHAQRLGKLEAIEFSTVFAAEIAALNAAYPDRSSWRVISDAFSLHRRHGEAVRAVLAQAVRDNALIVVDQSVPPRSLLSLILGASDTSEIELQTATSFVSAPGASTIEFSDPRSSIFPLRVVLTPERKPPIVKILGLSDFTGAYIGLIVALKPYHDEDCAEPLEPAQHRYVRAGELGDKNTIWQHAKRCRDDFAAVYEAVTASPAPKELLVQSRKPMGYRLDPEARFVEAHDASGPESGAES